MPRFKVNANVAKLSKVTDFLYIGGVCAVVPQLIEDYKISCIINCTSEVPNLRKEGVATLKLWLTDSPETDLSIYFDMVSDQIMSIQDMEGRTLVHCLAGVSRSASFCMAFLMKYEKKSLREAYEFLAARRPLVRPNLGYWRQLIAYEFALHDRISVKLVRLKDSDREIPDVYVSEEDEIELDSDSISVASSISDNCIQHSTLDMKAMLSNSHTCPTVPE